jgi:hypothetical protein
VTEVGAEGRTEGGRTLKRKIELSPKTEKQTIFDFFFISKYKKFTTVF